MTYIHRSLERKFLKMSSSFKVVMVTGASKRKRRERKIKKASISLSELLKTFLSFSSSHVF